MIIKKISRKQWIAGIAIAVMILLTIIVPPSRSQISAGSTYSRSPNGYSAWYAYMETQGVKIQRWQKPFLEKNFTSKKPLTLIRIKSERDGVDYYEKEWVSRGNHLIILGVAAKATEAPFTSFIPSPVGKVKIETTRRQGYRLSPQPNEKLALIRLDRSLDLSLNLAQNPDQMPSQIPSQNPKTQVKGLRDEFGSIVWQNENEVRDPDQGKSKGTLFTATTPYLAANAYQNEEGNFKFLANLVTATKTPIYIDEYIHGYKDPDEALAETEQSWINYLMKTPLFAGAVQALLVLIVFVIAKNRRFGAPIALKSGSINNSQAYIEALSSVLQKAQRHEFVGQAIAKAERKKLQQKLGMGQQEDQETLLTAWTQQTGRPKSELAHLLNPPKPKEQELLKWLQDWQKVLDSL